jgi:hypothetical protein
MRLQSNRESGQAAFIAIVVVLLLACLIGPLVLHFTQRGHNQLPLNVAESYPTNKEIAGGEVFATTLLTIIDHELSGGTGWRPNDFILWGPKLWADNNANRQLGIIQAARESTRIFKNHLTKVSATEFDPNLVVADTVLRNDAAKFWFPSAESKFGEAVEALRRYVAGLKTTPPTSKAITHRNIELIRLFQEWTDLLGDAHANLFKMYESDGSGIPLWKTDDYFYHAQGFAHVMYHLTEAIRREYTTDLEGRPEVRKLFEEVAYALHEAALLKPFMVVNGSPSGLFANHRRNLDVFIVEARQKMYSIREELEK